MKSEQLLKPRFKVIADFPDSEYKIGEIEDRDWTKYVNGEDDTNGVLYKISDFPHLFKELKWFEERKKEDMPQKLICKAIPGDTDISEIEEWDMEIMVGWINKEKRECCSLLSFNYEYGYFPVD